ncbi:LacI family transcriptional regulator [Promicromonospora sp. AC04]|uniref:LacI family DNA-binding transcriptional regulator n=1 Tax=Promicromonospora sp. AC04 TaxID=2135723 RepID=UPI000D347E96|nr:LacI family DNA-binding transcriptional regulator [Promicromonospora sp. AC04]PUB31554.1 LacI family transcriptional regulator [Promicromonospora sp. AC04]
MTQASERPGRRPTIADIAARAGVSPTAVSFALNDRPGISEQTRARILAAVAELGWRPNVAARALGGRRADTVGLVVARPARTLGVEPFFAQLVSGLQARLSTDLVALQLLVVEDMSAELDVYRRWAAERRTDGVVVLDLEQDDPRPEELVRMGLPAVLVGGDGTPGPVPAVFADDHAAMTALAEHLAALGHVQVGHVGGIPAYVHSARRVAALHDAGSRLGLHVTTVPTDFSQDEAAAATRALLARDERPTAIVYDSDVAALAGVTVLAEAGLSVPGDVSVASFDDSELVRLAHPPLTAMTRDTFELGELVAATTLSLVRGERVPDVVGAPTPELTVRGSTGPVPGGAA